MAGSYGKVEFGSHFMGGFPAAVTAGAPTPIGPSISRIGVNEGSIAQTVDEAGGIIAITTDTGDNDNDVIYGGALSPAYGPIEVEARFKYSNVDCAIFVGFTETLDKATPVMPAEFATATMTYNGTGGMVGFQYDVDGTTDDFRAVMGDGGAAISDSGNGHRVSATLTADRWFIARVVVNENGSAECWFGDSGHVASGNLPTLRLIKHFKTGTLLTNTDKFHPVLMIENRSANARVLECDYFFGSGYTYWATH